MAANEYQFGTSKIYMPSLSNAYHLDLNRQLKWLKSENIFKSLLLKFVRAIVRNKFPESFMIIFKRRDTVHRRDIRKKNHLVKLDLTQIMETE